MSQLNFQCTFGIRKHRSTYTAVKAADGPVKFTVAGPDGSTATVTLDPYLQSAQVQLVGMLVSAELCAWLPSADQLYANAYPTDVAAEIDCVLSALDGAARTVVETLKYYLGKTSIQDDVIGDGTRNALSWAVDETAYRPFPPLITASMTMSSETHLSDAVRTALQQSLDLGYRPFLGMRHLYRAIQETVPRFKWIDATIAAELSVKEALLRAKPELKTLLVNVPSPPISKLYGEVLEAYLGKPSPYRKALIAGAERRNKLIHRSEETPVTPAEAAEYVQTVMKAIHHLYELLYPEWPGNEALRQIEHYG
ncbi:MAG: hypothetical protein KA735_02700 [Burkholderiaceae bacterium]|nr:hypothetical protein [Burkholderiaceae bacterium]